MSDHVGQHIAELYEQIAHLRGVVERTHRQGKVTDVKYDKNSAPRIRMEVGVDGDGQPVKSPWVPVASHAGDRMIHAPVSVGQTMHLVSPDGNFESGIAHNYGFSDKVKSPSTDKDTHVDQLGKSKNTLKDGSWKQEVENASTEMTKGKQVLTGGSSTITAEDGKLTLKADTIILDGMILLGGSGASRPVALQLSQDTRGDQIVGNLASKVKAL